jgi:hypothetical protein
MAGLPLTAGAGEAEPLGAVEAVGIAVRKSEELSVKLTVLSGAREDEVESIKKPEEAPTHGSAILAASEQCFDFIVVTQE